MSRWAGWWGAFQVSQGRACAAGTVHVLHAPCLCFQLLCCTPCCHALLWAQLLHTQPSHCLPPHPHKSCHLRACLSLQFLESYREESQRLAEVHWAGCCWTPPLRGPAS